ncbi:TIGR04282 family arsenosugar biosynthesis glycosyltransferase [Spirosoma rhododendri]|uniref:Glycosyltransferase n=1 Tax=Spirosoma rhododendri TaxID=2728024 RepID=A0A7L5DLI5_9BACT|nr:TIGR04282 family arsenosugar biosynthesis glycosyltransferase [Spirosoma rhododendri]QJD78043.1 glycosyltransferase [Spirosoma rhododendri]
MTQNHLIIFVKNPIAGQVKTRIARIVGDEKAVAVYRELLRHTQAITQPLSDRRVVYYGDFINPDDGWNGYDKQLQRSPADLGERMQDAFAREFSAGAERVVIIGSDCLAITTEHLRLAFDALEQADIVIGPATDGGYYLLGMKQPQPFLFADMPWSQPELFQLTELAILQNGLTVELLETLTDIDEWTDYQRATQQA